MASSGWGKVTPPASGVPVPGKAEAVSYTHLNAVAETTVEMIPVYQEADQTAYDTLIESGMKINELSAEDMAAMREIAQPVYDMVRSEIGDEAVDALVSVIQ